MPGAGADAGEDDGGELFAGAGDETWEENLGAARAYFDAYSTLAAPVTAAIEDRPVGQWLANARKKGGLGKDPQRAARRAALLAAIDPDWNPSWPVDWQRHYAALTQLVQAGTGWAEVEPGTWGGGWPGSGTTPSGGN